MACLVIGSCLNFVEKSLPPSYFGYQSNSKIDSDDLKIATYTLASIGIAYVGKSIGNSRNISLKVQLLGTTLLSPPATIMRIQFSLFKRGFLLAKSTFNSSQNLLVSSFKVTRIFAIYVGTAIGLELLFFCFQDALEDPDGLEIPYLPNVKDLYGLLGYLIDYSTT